ncbi:uncharacterized protein LOC135154599, partial [Lytechinus pictus]|uniref:uncharacterized protein LOC135154599 n=1 Tax=Lytechinus pictus TaxID=7653 RepID=UPI0030B9FE89
QPSPRGPSPPPSPRSPTPPPRQAPPRRQPSPPRGLPLRPVPRSPTPPRRPPPRGPPPPSPPRGLPLRRAPRSPTPPPRRPPPRSPTPPPRRPPPRSPTPPRRPPPRGPPAPRRPPPPAPRRPPPPAPRRPPPPAPRWPPPPPEQEAPVPPAVLSRIAEDPVVGFLWDKIVELKEQDRRKTQQISRMELEVNHLRSLHSQSNVRSNRVCSRDEITRRLEFVTVDGKRTMQVTKQVMDSLLPFAPCHRDVSRRLGNLLFLREERINRNVIGIRNPAMDPERMGAIRRATFDLCPTGGEGQEQVWKRCVKGIDAQNRNLKRRTV